MQVGPYRTLDELGRGGMGVVYRAEGADGQVVALKLLLPHRAAEPRIRQRFLHELSSLSRLRHPHLVRLLAAGEHEGAPWLALEFVEGESLEDRLRHGPLPVAGARRIVAQLASALAYLHDCGVIHRDLKPANVLLRGDDALLTDFGLVLDREDLEGTRLTNTGTFLGTPGYWAPEQARGAKHEQGPHTDLYGLGAVLFACLTGQPPVIAGSLTDYLATQSFLRVTPPHVLRAEVPRWLSALCLRCLDPEPEGRPASAHELARRLRQGGEVGPAAEPRRPSWGLALGAVALAGLGVGGLAFALTRGAPPAAAALPAESEAQLREVEALLEAARPQDALPVIDAFLDAHPDVAHAHYLRGSALRLLERYVQARAAYDRALELDPSQARAWAKRGLTRWELDEREGAIADLDRSLELEPDFDPTLRLRGIFHSKLEDWERAAEDFERVLARPANQDRGEIWLTYGIALRQLERYGEAEQALLRASALDRESREVWAELAVVHGRMGQPEEALRDTERCLALEPNDPPMLRMRGSLLGVVGRHQEAVGAYTRALDFDAGDSLALGFRGLAYAELDDYAAAERDLRGAVEGSPRHADFWQGLGIAQHALRRVDEAVVSYTRALALDPNLVSARAGRGALALAHLDTARAIADLDRVLEVRPQNVQYCFLRSQAHEDQGEPGAALADLERCMTISSDVPPAWLYTAVRLMFELGRYAGIPEECRKLSSVIPDDPGVLGIQAQLARVLGNEEEERRLVEYMLRVAPEAEVSWLRTLEASRDPFALRALEGQLRALHQRQGSPQPWARALLGRCLLRLGERTAAYEQFLAALEGSVGAKARTKLLLWQVIVHALDDDVAGVLRVARRTLAETAPALAWEPALWLAAFGEPGEAARLREEPGLPERTALLLGAFEPGASLELAPHYLACEGPGQRILAASVLGLAAERRGELDTARARYRSALGHANHGGRWRTWAALRLAQLER